jgi:predicted ATPase
MARAQKSLAALGVRLPASPAPEEVRAAFEAVWSALGERAIEEFADLSPMTSPEALAATAMLVAVHPSALALGDDTFDTLVCRLVCASLTHGNADASALGYAALGTALVRRFGDYRSGYRFGKVAHDLVEGRQSALWRGMVDTYFGGTISIWTHHLRASIGYTKRALEAALASGNTLYARQNATQIALGVLVKGDPLEEVYRASSRPWRPRAAGAPRRWRT